MSNTEIPEGEYCVYRHIRPDKNEPFYIGIGKKERPYAKQGRTKIWQNIVNKNNGEYRVDILFEDVSREFACEKEMELIALYGRIDIKTGILANLTDGGDGVKGRLMSEEHRQIISECKSGEKHHQWGKPMTDEQKAKMSAKLKGRFVGELNPMYGKQPFLGKTHSEETRKKLSEIAVGKYAGTKNPAYRGKVYAYYMGVRIAEFESCTEAAKLLGATPSGLRSALNKKNKTVLEYEWRRFSEGDELTVGVENFKGYIYQLDISGKSIIDIHRHVGDAVRKTGFEHSGIYGCTSGKYRHSNGFKWVRTIETEQEFRKRTGIWK